MIINAFNRKKLSGTEQAQCQRPGLQSGQGSSATRRQQTTLNRTLTPESLRSLYVNNRGSQKHIEQFGRSWCGVLAMILPSCRGPCKSISHGNSIVTIAVVIDVSVIVVVVVVVNSLYYDRNVNQRIWNTKSNFNGCQMLLDSSLLVWCGCLGTALPRGSTCTIISEREPIIPSEVFFGA